jgi:hypothetical protein
MKNIDHREIETESVNKGTTPMWMQGTTHLRGCCGDCLFPGQKIPKWRRVRMNGRTVFGAVSAPLWVGFESISGHRGLLLVERKQCINASRNDLFFLPVFSAALGRKTGSSKKTYGETDVH